MKWKATPHVPGDLKVKNRFAWLPKRIGKYIIWLEYYQELHEYRQHTQTRHEWRVVDIKIFS